MTDHSYTLSDSNSKLFTCADQTSHPTPNCKLSAMRYGGTYNSNCSACKLGFFLKYLGQDANGDDEYQCVEDNLEDNPRNILMHSNLDVCKEGSVPDENGCSAPSISNTVIPNCRFHGLYSSENQTSKFCFVCQSGYGLSIDRLSCHNIQGLEGPVSY